MSEPSSSPSGPRSGWNAAKPQRLPKPSRWPIGLALAISVLAWAIVTSAIVAAVGAVLFSVCLLGWIGEIRHERRKHES